MKKNIKIITVVLIMSIISTTVFAYTGYDYMGWIDVGRPKYTKSGSSILSKSDISGTTIMSRLRQSYSYTDRMPKIANTRYKQSLLWIFNCPVDGYVFTDKTYLGTPYNGGEIGYTEWYDSPYGVFLDYETGNIKGTWHDQANRPPVSVQQDFIDYANVQFPNGSTNSAYIATSDATREFADAKLAAAVARDNSNKHYPIYANNGKEIDASVKVALKSKGVKNLYVLGGFGSFSLTAGLSGDFNIIRCGGLERNDTQALLKDLPNKMNEPNHYTGDEKGIVMEGVPSQYQAKIRQYLTQEKSSKNATNLITASEFIISQMNQIGIGSRTNSNSNPSMVIGVNDGAYETYWICYWSAKDGGYVYQYVLGNYYDKTTLNSDVVSIEESPTVYKQNNTNYWTKTNSPFNINTMGTISTKYDLTGTGLYLYNSKVGGLGSSARHEMTTSASSSNSTFNSDFTNNTSAVAKRGTYNGLNSINGKHTMSAKLDNQLYRLYSSTQYGYWSTPKDSGITLKTDGAAPTISGIPPTTSGEDVQFTLTAADSGSGVKSIVLIKDGKKIEGKTSVTTTASDEGENKYSVITTDNVGNTATTEFTVNIEKELSISGIVTPNPAPAGKKLILNINTIGNAKRIKVAFPPELVKFATVADPLIFEKNINIEKIHDEEIFAWLPLETPKTIDDSNNRILPPYRIYLECENKYGKIATGYIDLDVQGSIYSNLQYGIKATGYDRGK